MTTTAAAWRHVECVTGKGWPNAKGYLLIDRGSRGRVFAHRLAWEESFGPIPEGMQVGGEHGHRKEPTRCLACGHALEAVR